MKQESMKSEGVTQYHGSPNDEEAGGRKETLSESGEEKKGGHIGRKHH